MKKEKGKARIVGWVGKENRLLSWKKKNESEEADMIWIRGLYCLGLLSVVLTVSMVSAVSVVSGLYCVLLVCVRLLICWCLVGCLALVCLALVGWMKTKKNIVAFGLQCGVEMGCCSCCGWKAAVHTHKRRMVDRWSNSLSNHWWLVGIVPSSWSSYKNTHFLTFVGFTRSLFEHSCGSTPWH